MTTKEAKIKKFKDLILKEQSARFNDKVNSAESNIVESKKTKGVAAKNVEKELNTIDGQSQLSLEGAIEQTENKFQDINKNKVKLPRELETLKKMFDKLDFKPSTSKAGWYELIHTDINSELKKLDKCCVFVLVEEDLFSAVSVYGKVQKTEFPFYEKDQKYNAIDNLWYWLMDELIRITKELIEQRVLRQVARLKEYEASGKLREGYLIRNLDDRVYHHLNAPGVSNSTLGECEESCANLDEKHYPDPDQPKEEEPKYFITGRSVHDYILRNDVFLENNYVKPDKKNYSKRGLQEDKIHQLLGCGKNIVTESDVRGYKKAMRNLKRHPTAKMFMDIGENELSAYGELSLSCPINGEIKLLQRARFDKIIAEPTDEIKEYFAEYYGIKGDYGIITDLKYLRDNTDFRNKASDIFFDYGYHGAGAYYCHIAENIYKKKFYFVFMTVSKKNIHDVICYLLPDEFRRMGEERIADLAVKYSTDYLNVFNPVVQEFLKLPSTLFLSLKIKEDEREAVLRELKKISFPFNPNYSLTGLDMFCDYIDGSGVLMRFFGKHPQLAKKISRNLGWRGRHGDIIRIDASPWALSQHKNSKVKILKN